MLTEIVQHLEHILEVSGTGTLIEVIEDSSYVVALNASVVDVNMLWPKIVFDLSAKGLANGILDVPLVRINNRSSVLWIKDAQFLFTNSPNEFPKQDTRITLPGRPLLPLAFCLAIGGPTGVGKSTLIEKLFRSKVGNRVRRYVAYTTRLRRSDEVDGVDYFFVDPSKLDSYRNNPRFINFVEARGCWYWSDPIVFFESRWREQNLIHVFVVTQAHEFIERHKVIPDLSWVWLSASDNELHSRLEKRGDADVEKSIEQNRRLKNQNRAGLVSLELEMKTGEVDSALQELLSFIAKKERKET